MNVQTNHFNEQYLHSILINKKSFTVENTVENWIKFTVENWVYIRLENRIKYCRKLSLKFEKKKYFAWKNFGYKFFFKCLSAVPDGAETPKVGR